MAGTTVNYRPHPGLAKASAKPPFGLSNLLEIRQLIPADEPDMSRLLQQLDIQARSDRFGHDPGDAWLETYSCVSLATSPAVFGAFIGNKLIGIAEIIDSAPDNVAILAFAVDAECRRKGIGRELLIAALRWANRWGATHVQLQCTRTNWAVRQIAQKAEARLSLTSGTFLAEFDVRAAWTSAYHHNGE